MPNSESPQLSEADSLKEKEFHRDVSTNSTFSRGHTNNATFTRKRPTNFVKFRKQEHRKSLNSPLSMSNLDCDDVLTPDFAMTQSMYEPTEKRKQQEKLHQESKLLNLIAKEKVAQAAIERRRKDIKKKSFEQKKKNEERQKLFEDRRLKLLAEEEERRNRIIDKTPVKLNLTASCYGIMNQSMFGKKSITGNNFQTSRPLSSTGRVFGFGSSTPRTACEPIDRRKSLQNINKSTPAISTMCRSQIMSKSPYDRLGDPSKALTTSTDDVLTTGKRISRVRITTNTGEFKESSGRTKSKVRPRDLKNASKNKTQDDTMHTIHMRGSRSPSSSKPENVPINGYKMPQDHFVKSPSSSRTDPKLINGFRKRSDKLPATELDISAEFLDGKELKQPSVRSPSVHKSSISSRKLKADITNRESNSPSSTPQNQKSIVKTEPTNQSDVVKKRTKSRSRMTIENRSKEDLLSKQESNKNKKTSIKIEDQETADVREPPSPPAKDIAEDEYKKKLAMNRKLAKEKKMKELEKIQKEKETDSSAETNKEIDEISDFSMSDRTPIDSLHSDNLNQPTSPRFLEKTSEMVNPCSKLNISETKPERHEENNCQDSGKPYSNVEIKTSTEESAKHTLKVDDSLKTQGLSQGMNTLEINSPMKESITVTQSATELTASSDALDRIERKKKLEAIMSRIKKPPTLSSENLNHHMDTSVLQTMMDKGHLSGMSKAAAILMRNAHPSTEISLSSTNLANLSVADKTPVSQSEEKLNMEQTEKASPHREEYDSQKDHYKVNEVNDCKTKSSIMENLATEGAYSSWQDKYKLGSLSVDSEEDSLNLP